jgi:MbtH protein
MDYLYEEVKDPTIYKVVINHQEQYSVWYADRSNPEGWQDAGFQGSKEECLTFMEDLWKEMQLSGSKFKSAGK